MVLLRSSLRAKRAADGGWRFTGNMLDVTALYEANTARDAAEARLATLVEDGPGVLGQSTLKQDGTWQRDYNSKNIQRLTGYTHEEIIELGGWEFLLDAPGRAARAAAMAEMLTNGEASYDSGLRRADGRTIRTRTSMRAMPAGDGDWRIIGTTLDVTALHEANLARAAAEARLSALVNDSPSILFESVLLPDGTWQRVYLSANIGRILGPISAQIIATSGWKPLLDAEGLVAREAGVQQAIGTGESSYDCWFDDHAGRRARIRVAQRALPIETGGWRMIGTLSDVTALYEAQEQLDALLRLGPGMLYKVSIAPDGDRTTTFSHAAALLDRLGYSVAKCSAARSSVPTSIRPMPAGNSTRPRNVCARDIPRSSIVSPTPLGAGAGSATPCGQPSAMASGKW